VFYLITRRPYRGLNWNVLHRRAMLDELRRNTRSMQEQFGERLLQATAMGLTPDYNTLVDDYWKLRLRRVMHAWKGQHLPQIVTHDLDDPDDDVLKQLRYLDLVNRPEDPVKVVYHPDFISSTDPLFGMEYDQFVRGCHLGIFPSFYEPWGYTPLECVARGVPAVTSDLAGFGSYLQANVSNPEKRGVHVLPRRFETFDASADALANRLMNFCSQTRRQRITMRNRVESHSDQFDWQVLGKRYREAHKQVREMTGR
ncbi:MAG: glycosyltransferase, partial [Planctomycetota bacterium]